MNHKPYLDWMQSALDGALAREQRAQLEEHLAACADCQLTWGTLREMERLFGAEPQAAPRSGFTGRFKARLAQRQSQPRAMWGAIALGLSAIAAAAVVVPGGVALLVSAARAAQQPATSAALQSSFGAAAAFGEALLGALLIAGRALAAWALADPLAWAASLTGLVAAAAWLYWMRKLNPEVSFR